MKRLAMVACLALGACTPAPAAAPVASPSAAPTPEVKVSFPPPLPEPSVPDSSKCLLAQGVRGTKLGSKPPGTIYFGAAAIDSTAIRQTKPGPEGWLVAEHYLWVEAGTTVEVSVVGARTPLGGPKLGWGLALLDTVTIKGCPPNTGWVVYRSDIYVEVPTCVEVTVRAKGKSAQARIPAGAKCS